jgi:hypothetical protein
MVAARRYSQPVRRELLGPKLARVRLDDAGIDSVLDAVAAFLEAPGFSHGMVTLTLQRDPVGAVDVRVNRRIRDDDEAEDDA